VPYSKSIIVFFSDNQTNQKAYDRFYNATAKSDVVQGKKLQALIEKENMDDASADSLANLFHQVMAKTRENDYDQILKKLTKSAPKVIKGKAKSTAEARGDIYDIMGQETPKASTKTTTKKYTYVPESTDTDATMEQPIAEDVFLPFQSEVNDIAQKA
jgi:hypothetical protein